MRCAVILSLVALSGCSQNPVTVNKRYDFEKLGRIAVLGFEPANGDASSGQTISAIFEKLLIESGFDLVERQQVKKVLNEQSFQFSGAVDPKQAVELGKVLGVDALVFGTVTVYTPHQTSVVMVDIHSEHREPVVRKRKMDVTRNGKTVREDVDVVVDYRVTHEVREQPQIYRIQAESGAVVKMVDAQTGEIAWVGTATEEGSNIHAASEMVGRRIMNSLKKFLPVKKV